MRRNKLEHDILVAVAVSIAFTFTAIGTLLACGYAIRWQRISDCKNTKYAIIIETTDDIMCIYR